MNQYRKNIEEVEKLGNVRTHFQKQQHQYQSDINMAIYMDLDDVEKLNVFDIILINEDQDIVVNFYGFRMGLTDLMTEKLYKLFIREMDPFLRKETKRKYYIVLFDSPSGKTNCFDFLKDIFKRLPAIYFVKLNKIFDIDPAFLTKSFALINITSWSKFFSKYVEFVQNIEAFQRISQLKIYNILSKCPKQITKGIKVETQTPMMTRSAFTTKQPKAFQFLRQEFKNYILDVERQVPLILSILVETMKQSTELCLIEGIFRSAGSIEQEQDMLKEIMEFKGFKLIDSEKYCKRAIAGLTKKIFTEATTPLIPYAIYNHLLNQKIDQSNIQQYWQIIISQLPRLNKQILLYITDFLHNFILQNKQTNKMNAHNLSVVFTPCFFRAKQCSLADLINSGKFAAFFKWWIQNYQKIISTPENQQKNHFQRTRGNCGQINYQGGLMVSKQCNLFFQ